MVHIILKCQHFELEPSKFSSKMIIFKLSTRCLYNYMSVLFIILFFIFIYTS